MKKIVLFTITGTLGFIVDSGIFSYLYYIESFNMIFSRIISFIIAVLVTWILNRSFTFENNSKMKKTKEYLHYLKIQLTGAIINFIIFFSFIYFLEIFKDIPLGALAIASICAMFYNFIFSKKLLD